MSRPNSKSNETWMDHFERVEGLKHWDSGSKNNIFSCNYCGYNFDTNANTTDDLMYHIKSKHDITESKASEYTDEEQKILDHTMEAVKMEGFAMDPNAFTTPHTWVQGSAGADDIYCRVCGVSKSIESKASEDWDTDMAEKANKNMKKQFGDFYDPNFNAMDVPPEPKQQSVKDILAGFAEDMEQFDESLASEYSIKEEFDLQDQDGKYEMLSKADLSVTDATNYSTYSHDELPEEVKDSLKGDEDSFGESWSQKSSINRIEALERVGVKQGDAIKLSGLEFEDFGEDLQGELKGDLEDARKDMQQGVKSLNQLGDYNPNDSEDGKKVGLPHQYGEEVENPNSEFGQNYPDNFVRIHCSDFLPLHHIDVEVLLFYHLLNHLDCNPLID